MFNVLPECDLTVLNESVLILETLPVHAARLYGLIIGLATLAVVSISTSARAQHPWSPVHSGDIIFISDAQPNGSWLDNFKIVPRVAFRDDWVAPSPTPSLLVQSEVLEPTKSNGLPFLPPPADPAAASQEELVMPPQPDQVAGPVTEAPKEELKTEEKPAVPDLAKGILIATNEGDLTFKPGLRIQPRYEYEDGNDNNDFFIRRFRLKGSGSAFGIAKYGVELKIDNDGRFAVTPSARVENAWLDFPLFTDYTDDVYLRAGLYDIPFSRDALTSDSKLLFMDRTLIKEEVTGVGMADNIIGLMLHGRPYGGYFEYAFGLFDNVAFERFGAAGTRESDELMPGGRIVFSLLDPMTPPDGYADYQESYIGKGQRLELGANAVHLGDVIDGAAIFDLTAWGVDLFANSGHYTFQTEYDQIIENIASGADIHSDGWYAQFGYLFDPCDPCVEFAVRYQELDPLVGDTLRWTSIGFNFYIREHNLKVQTDYTSRSHVDNPVIPGGISLFDEDVFEVQLQLDF